MALERWRPFDGESQVLWGGAYGHSPGDESPLRQFLRPTCDDDDRGSSLGPPGDMYETKDDLNITFEVPGVREKEISVSMTGDLLTVKGERKWDTEHTDDSYHRLERVYGKFERSVALPVPVQSGKVKATYRDGVLEIRLPKVEEVKPKEIKIDVL